MHIIGHKKNLSFLESSLDNKTLSHAYCFAGSIQIGKKLVAKHIAAKILNTNIDSISIHSDFFYVEREIDKKKDRLKKNISIEQIKKINNFLQTRSWVGSTKVVVIDEAETIGVQAANAILKTLEESVENSFIVFLVNDEKNLPATVRSRCQLLNFYNIPENQILEGLIKMGFSKDLSEKASKASWGRPGRAINFLSDSDAMEEYSKEINRLKNIVGQPFYKQIQLTEDLFGDKTDAIRGRDKLKKILDLWIITFRQLLRDDSQNIFINKKFLKKDVVKIITDMQEVIQMLDKNIHPRLLIEKVLLNI